MLALRRARLRWHVGRTWTRLCASSSNAEAPSPPFSEDEKAVIRRQQALMGVLLRHTEFFGLDKRPLEEARDCSTVRIALAGPAGAGKSSMFNLIAGEKIQQTNFTRCTSSVTKLTLPSGHPLYGFTLVDTPGRDYSAGDRETGDAVISAADIVMYMTSKERLLNEQDRQELRRIHDRNPSKTFVVVVNKMDLCESDLEFEAIRTALMAQCLGSSGGVGLPVEQTSFAFVSVKAAESPASQVAVPFAPPGMEWMKVFLGPLRGHHHVLLETLRRKLECEHLAVSKIEANSRAIAQGSQRVREKQRQWAEAEASVSAALSSYLHESASPLSFRTWVSSGDFAAVFARLSARGRKWITTSWMEDGMVVGAKEEARHFHHYVGLRKEVEEQLVPQLKARLRQHVSMALSQVREAEVQQQQEEMLEGPSELEQRWSKVEAVIAARMPAICQKLETCLTAGFEERQDSVSTFTRSLLGLGAVTAVAAVPLKMSAVVAASGILSWTLLAQLPYSSASFPLCSSFNHHLCEKWEGSLKDAQHEFAQLMSDCIKAGTEDLVHQVERRCDAAAAHGRELEAVEEERKAIEQEMAGLARSTRRHL